MCVLTLLSFQNSPQIISNVHNVTYLNKLKPSSLLTSCASLVTKTALCSWNTSIKSSNILKWNVGVKIWMKKKTNKNECNWVNACRNNCFCIKLKQKQKFVHSNVCSKPLFSQMIIPFVENTTFCHAMLEDQCQAKAANSRSLDFCQCVLDCSWLPMYCKMTD